MEKQNLGSAFDSLLYKYKDFMQHIGECYECTG